MTLDYQQLAEHPENQLPDLPLLWLKDEGNALRRGAVPPASLFVVNFGV
jgi:hypothetical protein